MQLFSQIAAVTAVNIRSLPERPGSSLVVIAGIAGVVAVLVSILAMSTGMEKTMQNGGRADRVVILRNGSSSEVNSVILADTADQVMNAPGLARDGAGRPLVSGELLRLITLRRRADGTEVSVTIRGIASNAALVRPELKIVEGRMFKPGLHEVIIGRGVGRQFRDVAVGQQLRTLFATWTVVGVFATGGNTYESEIMADAPTLTSAYQTYGYSSLTAVLKSPASFQELRDFLASNPALSIEVLREKDYFAQQSKTLTQLITLVAYVVGGIMAIGAFLAAMNAMYSAVSTRTREIATLRALGFGSFPTVLSVLVEALVLALLGGCLGALIAWLFVNHSTVSSGATAQGDLVFDLVVSPSLMILGIVWACLIGLAGGLFPAIRAARQSVALALRAV